MGFWNKDRSLKQVTSKELISTVSLNLRISLLDDKLSSTNSVSMGGVVSGVKVAIIRAFPSTCGYTGKPETSVTSDDE